MSKILVSVAEGFFEPPPIDQDYLWKYIYYEADPDQERLEDDPCWVWTGARTGTGFPALTRNKEWIFVRRHLWELLCGPIPEGQVLKHKAPNRRDCVRPEHLFLSRTKVSRQEMEDQKHSWTARRL
jgi:hypothetical protein